MSKTRRTLLMLLALALVMSPLQWLLSAMLPDGAVNPVPGCIAGMVMALLTMGLPAWFLRPWTSPRLIRQKSLASGLVMAAAAALLTRTAVTPVDAVWQKMLQITPDALPMPENPVLVLLYIVALAVVPALMEEAFFRGAVLTGLLDGSRRSTAVLVTALSFALMHGRVGNLPSLLVLSLLLTLLMLHSGHLAVPMAAHLIYNMTALSGMSLPGELALLYGVLTGLLCGWLLLRQPKIAHPPMQRWDAFIAVAAIAVLTVLYFI